jgi:chemotaxis-related protein WspB
VRVLTFQVGTDRLALPLAAVVEVVPRVRLHRPAGAPSWLAGLLLHRGGAVPVVDLHALAGAGECPPALSSRIILVAAPDEAEERTVGLLAAQVADVRDLADNLSPLTSLSAPGQPDFGPITAEGGEVLRLLDVRRLLPEAARTQLRALTAEAPA